MRVLYERGAFAATNSTPIVSAVLAIFGLGLPAFVLIKAFTPGYFAREDTRTPMYLRGHLGGGQRLRGADAVPVIGAAGIATASAIAGWVNALLLLGVLIRRGHWGRDIGLLTRIPRLLIAAAVMGGFLYFGIRWFAPQLASASPLYTQAIDARACSSAVATVIYFAVAFGIGGADFGMIRRSIRRAAAKNLPVDPALNE